MGLFLCHNTTAMANVEQRKIQIIADGTQVNATFNDMAAAARLLQNQLRKLPPESEEFAKKSEELKGIKKNMNDLKGDVFGTEKALKDMNQEWLQMTPFGGMINGITGALGKARTGVTAVAASFNTLRGAIIATGLGALVVVLGLIINYLTSTQDGMDKVNRVLEPARVLWQRILGVLQDLGGYLVNGFTEAINSPKLAFEALVNFIRDQVINRINSVGVVVSGVIKILKGDFKEGVTEMMNGYAQGITGVENVVDKLGNAVQKTGEFISESVEQGRQLAEMNITIEKTENDLIVSRSRLNAQYQESKEIAQDQSRSEAERLAAAKAAQSAQNELLDQEQQFIDLKIERMELEQSFNDTNRSDNRELQELIAQRTDFEAQAARKRASARGLENTISKDIHSQQMKRLDEQRKKEEENQKRIEKLCEEYVKISIEAEQQTQDLIISLMDEGTEKKIAKLDLDLERELEKLEEKRIKLIENESLTEEERQAVRDQFAELAELKRQEHDQKIAEIKEQEREDAIKEQLDLADEDLERETLLLQISTDNAIDAEIRKKEALLQIQREYAAEKLAILEAAGEGESMEALKLKAQISQIDKDLTDLRISEVERYEQFKFELQQMGFESARNFMQLGLELMGEESKGRKALATTMKALEIGQVVSQGIKEVQSIWAGAAQLGPIIGPVVGGIQTGLAVSRTALAVNRIRSAKYARGGQTGTGQMIDMMMDSTGTWRMPDGRGTRNVGSFAKGGHVGSPSFGVIGEAGHEWVGPNWMIRSPKYANIFGYLEAERRRATPFATGGATTPQAQIPQNSSATADLQQFLQVIEEFGEMREVMEQIRDLLEDWPTKLRVVNDPRDIVDGVRVLNEIESDSRINRG